MSLTQSLIHLRAGLRADQSPTQKAVMDRATAALESSGLVNQSLKVNELAPNFMLPNHLGQIIELQSLLRIGPVVLSFYRGAWCPYCNLELHALQKIVPQLQQLGTTLVAISPQIPDHSLSTSEKNGLTFEVLSDVGNQVAHQYGLVFTLPDALRPIYQDFGIDIPAHNGSNSFELPIPATYIIAPDRRVVRSFVDPDYTKRLDPEDILNALTQLKVVV